MPRDVDRKARGVGTQVWNAEENLTRAWLVGVQCSGRLEEASNMACSDSIVDICLLVCDGSQAEVAMQS